MSDGALPARAERPLRILYVFRAPVGGLFRNVFDVIRALAARGHSIGLLCDSQTGGERGERLLAQLAPLLPLGIHRMPMHRNPHWTDLPALMKIRALVRDHDVDVIHGHGAKGGLYARFPSFRKQGGRPIRCYTPHGGSLNYYPGSLAHKGFMFVEKLLESSTDLFLFESRFINDRYAEFVCRTEKPVVIALNGLHQHEFEPVVPREDATDFLYVGEFREAKGIDTLVEALFLLAADGVFPTITMVGSGPSEARIRQMIVERGLGGSFRWQGVTPASEAFRLGRIMVVPSRFESLPYIVLEAVAGQLPLISTHVGGIPEVLPRDYPLLIPPNDPARLAEAMRKAVQTPFEALRQTAARLSADVQTRFTVPLMVNTVEGAYRRVLEKG
ncbi:MAG: glycosyltransferase family 4 protein [Beijerinckiaceae bacterium]|nr:glycosyltransferase family 4 protein [Beijerinckiaceae bacterium]MCZ8301492.1 glycosyltransferase family 4 protein [Beijerinckiaceae bacterium]